jgi:hypothetical protein
MDTCRDVHFGVDYLEGEGCYDHAHPWKEVNPLELKRTWGTCPKLDAG